MASKATTYQRGEMNIQEQVSTYAFVMGLTKWGSLAIAALLLFLTLWFCTPAGLGGALVSAIVLSVIGVLLLRDKGGAH